MPRQDSILVQDVLHVGMQILDCLGDLGQGGFRDAAVLGVVVGDGRLGLEELVVDELALEVDDGRPG